MEYKGLAICQFCFYRTRDRFDGNAALSTDMIGNPIYQGSLYNCAMRGTKNFVTGEREWNIVSCHEKNPNGLCKDFYKIEYSV